MLYFIHTAVERNPKSEQKQSTVIINHSHLSEQSPIHHDWYSSSQKETHPTSRMLYSSLWIQDPSAQLLPERITLQFCRFLYIYIYMHMYISHGLPLLRDQTNKTVPARRQPFIMMLSDDMQLSEATRHKLLR